MRKRNFRLYIYKLHLRWKVIRQEHRRTGQGGGGGARGAAAPPKFWVTWVFWAGREIWAKPVFKDVFKFFFFLNTYIFSIFA